MILTEYCGEIPKGTCLIIHTVPPHADTGTLKLRLLHMALWPEPATYILEDNNTLFHSKGDYHSLGKVWHEKIFVRHQIQQKLNTRKFSYYKEIEQFIMVCSRLRRKFFTTDFFSWIFPTTHFSQTAVCGFAASLK